MIAFDTDILSDLAREVPSIQLRVASIPAVEQYVPIVAAEEALRGQLATIRRAQAGAGSISAEVAYAYLQETLELMRGMQFLAYTQAAEMLFRTWRAAKIRIGTQDLRIAAIAFAHNAKLVTRNARDYTLVPGLNLEVWN